jgi:hypothetical protein
MAQETEKKVWVTINNAVKFLGISRNEFKILVNQYNIKTSFIFGMQHYEISELLKKL